MTIRKVLASTDNGKTTEQLSFHPVIAIYHNQHFFWLQKVPDRTVQHPTQNTPRRIGASPFSAQREAWARELASAPSPGGYNQTTTCLAKLSID